MSPPPSRSPHSLLHHPRPAAEERTGSGTPIGCGPHSRQPPRPGPRDVTGWRGASFPRLVRIGLSCLSRPLTGRIPRPPLLASPSHPLNPVSIWAGWGRERARVGRERPMGAPKEGREAGSAAGRPKQESSANGRAPHIPGSGAPLWPLAFRRVAPRATPGWRWRGRGTRWKGGRMRRGPCGRARAAIVACSRTAYAGSVSGELSLGGGLPEPRRDAL